MAESTAKFRRHAEVAKVFTPGAPIDSIALFAGRTAQVLDVINAVSQRGQHVMLYGERGVGKTSLANVLTDIFADKQLQHLDSAGVNCDSKDTFYSLWRKALAELDLEVEDDAYAGKPSPEDVRHELEHLPRRTLVVIDELDRLEDNDALSLLADTVKTLSDHSVQATLVLVGVADSIDQLIGDHRSVTRALVQVHMPRMSRSELAEVIDNGLNQVRLEIEPDARIRIAQLSEGLPYYTHLLSLHSAQHAIIYDRDEITQGDVHAAIELSVQKVQHSIRKAHQDATRSPQKDNLLAHVLLACALAPKDEFGFFTAASVRDPMSRIRGKAYDIPAFAKHLKRFSDGPARVLVKEGEPRKFVYRFEDPLLQPFVILDGLSRGLITEGVLGEIQRG